MEYDKKWIKEGIEVAHRDNIEQKMVVEDFKRKSRGEMFIILGVKCHWWEEYRDKTGEVKKRYQYGTFHTKELVPWEIVMRGHEVLKEWKAINLGL